MAEQRRVNNFEPMVRQLLANMQQHSVPGNRYKIVVLHDQICSMVTTSGNARCDCHPELDFSAAIELEHRVKASPIVTPGPKLVVPQ